MKQLLSPISAVWGFISKLRHLLYDYSIFKAHKVSALVISVGNISVGGTGKTPFVSHLLSLLEKKQVALLSRGYKSKAEHSSLIASKGKGPIYSAQEMGDEPYLLSQKHPYAYVYIGKHRTINGQRAVSEGCTHLILDDAMQHRRLKRDVEIVTMKGSNLFGGGYFLPLGRLRDSPKRLQTADFIVVDGFEKSHLAQIRTYSNSPVIGVEKEVTSYEDLSGEKKEKPRKAALFCGIADPNSFITLIKNEGIELVDTLIVGDHQKISSSKLYELFRKHKLPLLCTEKDGVKLEKSKLPIIVVRTELKISYGRKNYEALCRAIGV